MGWRKCAGLLAVLALAPIAGCAHPPPPTTRPAHPVATTEPSEDEDIAALTAALEQNFGLHVQHGPSTVYLPPIKEPIEADRFVVTSRDESSQTMFWILSPEASAEYTKSERSGHSDGYGAGVWNGRVYVLFEKHYEVRRLIQKCIEETNCPLIVTIITGPEVLELQLKNRLKRAVDITQMQPDAPMAVPGYKAWSDDLYMESGFQDPAESVLLPPGGKRAWPMLIEIAPDTDAKIDAQFKVPDDFARDAGMNDSSIVAPSVRVHRDAAGRYTVTPWKPTALSPAELARTQQLSAFAQAWSADVVKRLATASDTSPHSAIGRDKTGHIDRLRFVLLTTSGGIPLGVRIDVSREGDLHGLAIAETMDPIKWVGQQSQRSYRVPGSDWILRVITDPGVSPKVQSAIDDCFNAFLHQAGGAAGP